MACRSDLVDSRLNEKAVCEVVPMDACVPLFAGGVTRPLLLAARILLGCLCLVLCGSMVARAAGSAWVRVSQVGYEAGSPARAYLMSTVDETGATYTIEDERGRVVGRGSVGTQAGSWAHSRKLSYLIYPIDFQVVTGQHYVVRVNGPAKATSPVFAVGYPEVLYPSLLVNSLFFYETQRDGPDFIANALRSAPGHLNDADATRYVTPPLDADDDINNVPPTKPLVSAGLPRVDVSGGWWDAGDYIKYVETVSYTAALMETGVRDFPHAMGSGAPLEPPAAPNMVSYAGRSGTGAPRSSDFSAEAQFAVEWLLKMWDGKRQALSLQVDNSQEWNYYGGGDIASTACGGSYTSPYCLITEYDVWTLPQAADHYEQEGDPQPCYPLTTIFLCQRPVFQAAAADAKISPNLAGRLAASFALCYTLQHTAHPALARRCLSAAQEVYALADTSLPDPAAGGGPGSLTTAVPFDGYGETVWEDDMEWGATELAIAVQTATHCGDLAPAASNGLSERYLREATGFASGYIRNVAGKGDEDTLNLYDVSGLAHFELVRALHQAEKTQGFALTADQVQQQLLRQVEDAIQVSKADPWDFGEAWDGGDVTSHGAGLSVMASEAYALTGEQRFDSHARRWLANILGANAWGSSFLVGEGSTFPNCIQHQVANLVGSLQGTSGGTPILWGAAVEGPSTEPSSGLLDGMRVCPANGIDTFAPFNGNAGEFDKTRYTRFKDDVQSYSTTEPAVDLTATSFLMWSWRLEQPAQ